MYNTPKGFCGLSLPGCNRQTDCLLSIAKFEVCLQCGI